MTAPTLLARRREQRDAAVKRAMASADAVRICVVEGFSDLRTCVDMLSRDAAEASRFAALVADLEAVAGYGATGGR